MFKDDYAKIFSDKSVVMVVMAHPDDLDVFCGGTVARLIADGKRVITVKLTSGDRGCRGENTSPEALAARRANEDALATAALGIPAADSINLGLTDGSVDNSLEVIGRIAYVIRRYQPEIIITTNPEVAFVGTARGRGWVNHRDHRYTALSAVDAAYPYSRDLSFFPEHFDNPQIKPGRCDEFLIVDGWSSDDDVAIEISGYLDGKSAAVRSHRCQFDDAKATRMIAAYTEKTSAGAFERFRHVVVE